jgi:vancomycin resistance protein YoaR
MKMKKKKVLIVSSVFLLACIILAVTYVTISATLNNGKICKGVFVDTVDLSGMTASEAQEAVDNYIEQRTNKKITIKVDNEEVSGSLKDLGFTCLPNDYIEEAAAIGQKGNLIKRYKEVKDVEKNPRVFKLEFAFDDSKVKALVESECKAFDIEAVNATMKRENGEFIITDHQVGRKINVESTITAIKNSILNDWNGEDIVVEAVVEEDIPEYTSETLEECTDLLGTYTTNFADSKEARVNNVTTAAKYINGSILLPGEIFSAYEGMAPITLDHGYQLAGAYENGVVIESVGGGVCQVSSTLYNAVLLAELEVVERSPHSMIVAYVKPSRDAAIAGTYKDLKFKNNTEYPVYIESYIEGRNITFSIYGKETRPANRKVEYVSETTETIQPPEEEVTEDPTKPTTFREVTQAAHVGYKAVLWKIIYIDGVETERVQVNASSYMPAPQYVTVGTKEEEKEEDKDKDKDKDKDQVKDTQGTDTNKPGKEDTDSTQGAETGDETEDVITDDTQDEDAQTGDTETDNSTGTDEGESGTVDDTGSGQ